MCFCCFEPSEDFLIDIFYHFKYSAKRWEEFFEIQAEFQDIGPIRVLKHSTTRSLSLLHCLKSFLQWPAFAFILLIEKHRVQSVGKSLKNLKYSSFAGLHSFALQPFNKLTTVFQTHPSHIGSIQNDTLSLLRRYLANFIKTVIINATQPSTIVIDRKKNPTMHWPLVQRLY